MNWMVHGTTNLCVGFERDGDDCEGGNCEHLKHGDQAFGYSGEADTWGREIYLDCEACYKEFLENRKTEPMDCHDCGLEVPRNEGVNYTPYDIESTHAERMNRQFFVCNTCRELETHKRRLALDEERREEDRQLLDDQSDEYLDNSLDDDDDPLDDDDIDSYPEEDPFNQELDAEEDPNEAAPDDDDEPLDFPFNDDEDRLHDLYAASPLEVKQKFNSQKTRLIYDARMIWGKPMSFSPTVQRVEVSVKQEFRLKLLQQLVEEWSAKNEVKVNEVLLDNKWMTRH